MLNVLDTFNIIETRAAIIKKLKTPLKKDKKWKNQNNNQSCNNFNQNSLCNRDSNNYSHSPQLDCIINW